jgi:tetratricopeptide (TPR) repeat protein
MLRQLERGLQDLERAVESAPNDMSPYFNRTGLRADAGHGDGALADLDRSIRIDPMSAASRTARAGLFEVMGWTHEAQLDAETAYRLVETFVPKKRPIVDQVLKTWRGKRVRPAANAPSAGGAPLQAAATAVRAKRYRAALAILDAALRKHPGDDTLLDPQHWLAYNFRGERRLVRQRKGLVWALRHQGVDNARRLRCNDHLGGLTMTTSGKGKGHEAAMHVACGVFAGRTVFCTGDGAQCSAASGRGGHRP